MDCQDWQEVKIGRGSSSAKNTGFSPITKYSESTIRQAKLANDNEGIPKPLKKHLSVESRQEMIKKRVELGLTQIKLNQQCSFPINTIRDFENGSVVPTGAQLNVLSRILGIRMKLE